MSTALSPREAEILGLLATGLSAVGVADELVLSPETIRTHVRNAMLKLDAKTRLHAVVIALRRGDIAFPDLPEDAAAPREGHGPDGHLPKGRFGLTAEAYIRSRTRPTDPDEP